MFKPYIIFYVIKFKLQRLRFTRTTLLKWQHKKLAQFAKKHLIKSPYYQNYISVKPFNINEIPIIDKLAFMEHMSQINTLNINSQQAMQEALDAELTRNFKNKKHGITFGLSTGTTGKRGLFMLSTKERAQWVALVLLRVIKPIWFKKQHIAFFLRANSALYSSVNSFLFQFHYFDIFKPIDTLLPQLQKLQPNILAAQPSVLIEICKAQKHKLINIKPTQIISFAEVLTPELKQGLIQTFKVPVKEVYQCTEGFLGVTCAHGTMHLNEDIIYIEKEWVNTEHTMFMPIVTDFTRSTQPIVRYRLNDVLEINPLPCPCGLPFTSIKQIIGRSDDVLHINNRTLNPDIISRAIALQTDAFIAYTITQRGKHKLIVTIDAPSNIFPKLCSVIQITLQQLIQIHCQTNTIDIEFVADKVVQMGEKWRTVKRIIYEN